MINKFIAIEGNIGSGKTTLAKKLSEKLNARLMLEEFEENPFLKGFYRDPQRYGFSVEMSFLADRYRQLSEKIVNPDLFSPLLISDYAPFKSLIFAQNNLATAEYNLYRKFWQMSIGQLNRPDLVVFLVRSIEDLQTNIKKRGRSYEQNIPDNYLKEVGLGYENFLRTLKTEAILRVDVSKYDFVNNSSDIELVANLIMSKIQGQ
jgi:deoxyadenosine/deoxycytidine kinase